jgi:hypothetical protein
MRTDLLAIGLGDIVGHIIQEAGAARGPAHCL